MNALQEESFKIMVQLSTDGKGTIDPGVDANIPSQEVGKSH
jgi:hypothetical protein